MNSTGDEGPVTVSRSEVLALTVGGVLGGGALGGLIAFALERFGHVAPSVAYGVGFFVLGLLLYVPLRIRRRANGAPLTLTRFIGASAAGSVVAGVLVHLLS